MIWPGSMPCRIDREEQVRIAHFGTSNIGRLKKSIGTGSGIDMVGDQYRGTTLQRVFRRQINGGDGGTRG